MSPRCGFALGLVLAIWTCNPSFATEPPPPNTPEGTLSFARSLLHSGDSFRAATEYLRYLHHYGEEAGRAEAMEGLGRAYSLANRYDEAAAVFRRLLEEEGGEPDGSRWLLGAALYQGKRYEEAADVLLGGATGDPERVLGTLAVLREGPDKPSPPGVRADVEREYRELPRKSPGVAGTLSAVLPGAGHFYCGRPRDGTVSFLLNAVFLWGIYESAQRENWPVVGILGFFELGWYTGNIVSSVNAAHKWNRREQGRFYRRWEERSLPRWNLAALPRGLRGVLSWRW